jgi:hypothetical protein
MKQTQYMKIRIELQFIIDRKQTLKKSFNNRLLVYLRRGIIRYVHSHFMPFFPHELLKEQKDLQGSIETEEKQFLAAVEPAIGPALTMSSNTPIRTLCINTVGDRSSKDIPSLARTPTKVNEIRPLV